ncbi:hypothetical protein G6L08_22645 [Agrobacterium rhizogenes]|nr:hypothetical protein [Rhizobium rhizogenes]
MLNEISLQTSYFKTLLEAVGLIDSDARNVGLDSAAYFHMLATHRIEARAWSKHETFYKENYPELYKIIAAQLELYRVNAVSQCNAISRLADQLEDGESIIILKGIRSLLRTGDLSNVRRAWDVDVILPDDVIQHMAAFEGIEMTHTGRRLPPHEVAHFDYNGVSFDVHAFFPICQPARLTDSSIVISSAKYGSMEHSFIRDNSIIAESFSNGRVRIPRAEVAALISISCMYGDYIACNLPHGRDRSPIRLGEILELREMLYDSDFNANIFVDFMELHEMRPLVRWMADIFAVILPSDSILASMLSKSESIGLPATSYGYRTILYGLWYHCGRSVEESIATHPGTHWLAKMLETKFQRRVNPSENEQIASFYNANTEEEIPGIRACAIRERKDGTLNLSLWIAPRHHAIRIVVDSQGDVFQFYVETSGTYRFRANRLGNDRVTYYHYEDGIMSISLRDREESLDDNCVIISVSEHGERVYDCLSIAALTFQ